MTLASGEQLILDAGTGIRTLGLGLVSAPHVNILLTHLHLDHIQGLMFFPPCFRSDAEITIWGPASPEASLEDRIARYISAPLSPVEVRELAVLRLLPRHARRASGRLGSATIRCEAVNHRGPTLGYRITEGDTTLCYIPDHEPALGTSLDDVDPEWISGHDLALDADLLIHDGQYTDEEYPDHVGWGHSGMSDALTFASRVGARRLLLFHHDPLHSDRFLDDFHADARRRWGEMGREPSLVEMGMEGAETEVEPVPAGVAV